MPFVKFRQRNQHFGGCAFFLNRAFEVCLGHFILAELMATAARFGKSVRKGIDESAKAGDADTSDLFTGVSRDVDKSLWLLEAHLQADR